MTAPGVYPRIPMAQYHRWPGLSNSKLNLFRRSPAHLKFAMDNPPEQTPAMLLGTVAHTAILEPDNFKYVRGPEGDARTKAYKNALAALELEHGPGLVVPPAIYDKARAMRDRVWQNEAAAGLLGAEGDAELTLVWDEGGILARGRLDRASWKLDGGTVVDAKTTTNAELLAFERTIFKYGYHRQGAWYLRGAMALKIAIAHYVLIAIESEPPHEVAVYRLAEDALAAGWDQIEPLLDVYRRCEETGVWPGYPGDVRDIGLPAWAWGQITDEVDVHRF